MMSTTRVGAPLKITLAKRLRMSGESTGSIVLLLDLSAEWTVEVMPTAVASAVDGDLEARRAAAKEDASREPRFGEAIICCSGMRTSETPNSEARRPSRPAPVIEPRRSEGTLLPAPTSDPRRLNVASETGGSFAAEFAAPIE